MIPAWNKNKLLTLAIVPLLFVAFLFLNKPQIVKDSDAQELGSTEFSKKYNDYKLSLEDYNSAHADYVLARENYLKYGTLTSQTNAQIATVNMLQKRDDVLIAYFRALKERVNETKGIDDGKKNEINSRLDEEIGWFSEHKGRVGGLRNLNDLVDSSDEARDRYADVEGFLYKSLYGISEGKINEFRSRLIVIFEEVKGKVETIKNEKREGYAFSDQKIDTMERWIGETEARIAQSDEDQTQAVTSSEKIQNSGTFKGSIKELEDVRQDLKDASIFVKEIIREIKIAE